MRHSLISTLCLFLTAQASAQTFSEEMTQAEIKSAAEAYYDQMSQEQMDEVTNTYRLSKSRYKSVYGTNGTKLVPNQQADAYKDARTYFVELSEAYWGENDFYPFDYAELERHDSRGFTLLTKLYGERTIPANPHGITLPPTTLTQWLAGKESKLDTYYRKHLDANGLSIVSSRFVSDSALVQARYIINTMLSRIPEAKQVMLDKHFRIGIIGAYENVTDMPECRIMPVWWPDTDWDARGRGYGATISIPLMTCGEENIIKIPNYTERYLHESIMVHEFAHNVDFGLRRGREGFEQKLLDAFSNAQSKGLWKGTYSMSNSEEYFAEGVQAWFNTCNMYVTINGRYTRIQTREQLKAYDPTLHALLAEVMPSTYMQGYHFEIGAPLSMETPKEDSTIQITVSKGKIDFNDNQQYVVYNTLGIAQPSTDTLPSGFYIVSNHQQSISVLVP